jgi:hypothetical protein
MSWPTCNLALLSSVALHLPVTPPLGQPLPSCHPYAACLKGLERWTNMHTLPPPLPRRAEPPLAHQPPYHKLAACGPAHEDAQPPSFSAALQTPPLLENAQFMHGSVQVRPSFPHHVAQRAQLLWSQ